MSLNIQPSNQSAGESATPMSQSKMSWVPIFLALGYLWFRLINNLRLEWATNPQYAYGWLVPFLCLGLIIRRWHGFVPNENRTLATSVEPSKSPWSIILLFALLAFLYLPTRLIEAATPEWRPIQWALGVEAVGLTLCAIYFAKGRNWLKQLAFPICFFLVAIPWPTLIEIPIIQTLTRASANIVVELLGWLDVPAMAHGNVIEVGTGWVGIDEACSGIRSFQSSLMISIFFGEFYGLSRFRRLLLIPLGFIFSMGFNVCRMSLLTFIAAKKGVAAIAEYHDPAGITITILCTLTLWGLAGWLKNQSSPASKSNESELKSTGQDRIGIVPVQNSEVSRKSVIGGLALALVVWLVTVEVGVQVWYWSRESHLKPGPTWSLNFPQGNPTLKNLPMDEKTRDLLRFDEGKQAEWTESDGTQWQAYYFSWLPGRVAGYLAKRHTPEICLQATGLKMLSGPDLTVVNIKGVELPIRSYVFATDNGPIQVFHCRWEAGAGPDTYVEHESARYNLVRAIWAGRGKEGQKVFEVIISGMDDPVQARAALLRELNKLIIVKSP
jgi:exosortase